MIADALLVVLILIIGLLGLIWVVDHHSATARALRREQAENDMLRHTIAAIKAEAASAADVNPVAAVILDEIGHAEEWTQRQALT